MPNLSPKPLNLAPWTSVDTSWFMYRFVIANQQEISKKRPLLAEMRNWCITETTGKYAIRSFEYGSYEHTEFAFDTDKDSFRFRLEHGHHLIYNPK